MSSFTSDGLSIADIPELSKDYIRQKVWNYLQNQKIARFPTPPHQRIPNFEGSRVAGRKVANLEVFLKAKTIKVNPDKPQEEVRFCTLQHRKTLLVPTPRLKTGLFNELLNDGNDSKELLQFKSTSGGVKCHSKPISLQKSIAIDLIVIGSVAVSCTGRRIGKGEGFADLEYAMMKENNAVTDATLVVTTLHDCQVFDDLPSRLFSEYDVPIDIIVTPTRIIETKHNLEKPKGIYWNLLDRKKLSDIPVLRLLSNKR